MSKRLKTVKLWYVWVAVSAVIILAGVILYALLGMSYAADNPEYKTFEVEYSAVAEIREKEEDIAKDCESVFSSVGLKNYSKTTQKEVGGSYNTETGNKKLVYRFSAKTSDETLEKARGLAQEKLNENYNTQDLLIETSVSVGVYSARSLRGDVWRAALAIAVGAVVVLIYVGVRYGIGSALSGLVCCADSVLVTLGLLAIFRIPMYAFTPLLCAAIAAITSLLLWLLQAIKMKENFKDVSYESVDADEAIARSLTTTDKFVAIVAGVMGVIVLVVGLVAAAGVRTLVLPALIPVAVSAFSAMLAAPSIHVFVKRAFDKLKISSKRKYVGRKKVRTEVNENDD